MGWGLPAYFSVKAVESPSPTDDIQWLTYWIVFGFFNFLESFALRIVLYYLPWYFAFKTLFILWLQLPAFRVRNNNCFSSPFQRVHQSNALFQGAETLYGTVVRPLFSSVNKKTYNTPPTTSSVENTITADNLRNRAANATTE